MALTISLLGNYLIICISGKENLVGFYLHIIHVQSVGEFLSRAVYMHSEISMAKDND